VTRHFPEFLTLTASQVEQALDNLLPKTADTALATAMRHAVLNGGKRLRAFLVMESGQLYGVQPAQSLRAAAAVECVHAYSLVHDDLPCMDDDDLRRGQPTVHIKWDEATAVLVGDALQTLAFEILSGPQTAPDTSLRLRLIRDLAIAAGSAGMVLGQAQDVAAETALTPLTLEQITVLQANKTGALIGWAAAAGPIMGRSDTSIMAAYAGAIGLAFQIQDDILDVEGSVADTGKRLQKDAAAGKATFVSLLGLDQAKRRASDLVSQACDVLSPFGASADNLRQVARFVIDRNM
jgi:farnesyl diphosphate synthase